MPNIQLIASETRPLQPGSPIPNVFIQDLHGERKELRSIVGIRRTILVFYRGGWCPYCNLQLQNLRKIDVSLTNMGYQLVALSPDSPQELGKTIEKNELPYQFYSDSKMEASKAFGIAFRLDDKTIERYKIHDMDLEKSSGENHHLLPIPSIFLVGVDGIIRYVYSNPDYKVRMDTGEFLVTAKTFRYSS